MPEKVDSSLVEVDRIKVANIGGSPYIRVPKRFRREPFILNNGQYPYEAVFLQTAGSDDVVIRIEKIDDEKRQDDGTT